MMYHVALFDAFRCTPHNHFLIMLVRELLQLRCVLCCVQVVVKRKGEAGAASSREEAKKARQGMSYGQVV
jgi:hypothetical protein